VVLCGVCGQKMAAKDIQCMVNIACHVKQSTVGCRSSRKDGQVSKTNIELVGLHSDSNHKNLRPQVSRDL